MPLINTKFSISLLLTPGGKALQASSPLGLHPHCGRWAHYHLAVVKALTLTWLPLTPPQQKREVEIQSPHAVSTDTAGG